MAIVEILRDVRGVVDNAMLVHSDDAAVANRRRLGAGVDDHPGIERDEPDAVHDGGSRLRNGYAIAVPVVSERDVIAVVGAVELRREIDLSVLEHGFARIGIGEVIRIDGRVVFAVDPGRRVVLCARENRLILLDIAVGKRFSFRNTREATIDFEAVEGRHRRREAVDTARGVDRRRGGLGGRHGLREVRAGVRPGGARAVARRPGFEVDRRARRGENRSEYHRRRNDRVYDSHHRTPFLSRLLQNAPRAGRSAPGGFTRWL